jgi:hypothetical protein
MSLHGFGIFRVTANGENDVCPCSSLRSSLSLVLDQYKVTIFEPQQLSPISGAHADRVMVSLADVHPIEASWFVVDNVGKLRKPA